MPENKELRAARNRRYYLKKKGEHPEELIEQRKEYRINHYRSINNNRLKNYNKEYHARKAREYRLRDKIWKEIGHFCFFNEE